MAWYPGMSENHPALGSAAVITSLDMMAEATRLCTKAVLLVARARSPHLDITIGDVSRVMVGYVRMPPNEMCMMRYRPEDFMIVVEEPH